MKTILITGTSSGFGLETAKYFLERGWRVIATMRSPKAELFPSSPNLRILPLDVTSSESIRKTIEAAGPIDVLVNNAGIGHLNAVEGSTMEHHREIFETNTLGTIAMVQAVLPQMRERKSGVIINVTSTVTLQTYPLLSVYTASKAAVNAFTESLALELEQFNIKVRLVLPGRAPNTDFAKNAFAKGPKFPPAYQQMIEGVLHKWATNTDPTTESIEVAEAIWEAVTRDDLPMKIPAGKDAVIQMKGH